MRRLGYLHGSTLGVVADDYIRCRDKYWRLSFQATDTANMAEAAAFELGMQANSGRYPADVALAFGNAMRANNDLAARYRREASKYTDLMNKCPPPPPAPIIAPLDTSWTIPIKEAKKKAKEEKKKQEYEEGVNRRRDQFVPTAIPSVQRSSLQKTPVIQSQLPLRILPRIPNISQQTFFPQQQALMQQQAFRAQQQAFAQQARQTILSSKS